MVGGTGRGVEGVGSSAVVEVNSCFPSRIASVLDERGAYEEIGDLITLTLQREGDPSKAD
jgi:hypothetical protein